MRIMIFGKKLLIKVSTIETSMKIYSHQELVRKLLINGKKKFLQEILQQNDLIKI